MKVSPTWITPKESGRVKEDVIAQEREGCESELEGGDYVEGS